MHISRTPPRSEVKAKREAEAAPVVDLMAALKRSLAQESGEAEPKRKRKAAPGDRRQRNLLLPLAGVSKEKPVKSKKVSARAIARRRHKTPEQKARTAPATIRAARPTSAIR
jgi:hypothetical protein